MGQGTAKDHDEGMTLKGGLLSRLSWGCGHGLFPFCFFSLVPLWCLAMVGGSWGGEGRMPVSRKHQGRKEQEV